MNTEEKIKVWKKRLTNKSQISEDQLAELESHLRDEMDLVQAKELTEEEKLLVSMHRIGSPDTLNKAYSRSFLQGLFPFFMAMALLVLFRSTSTVLQNVGAQIYSALSIDISAVNYTIACLFYLVTIGFVYLVYRQTMQLKRKYPDGSKAQFLLAKYMGITLALMFLSPLLVRLPVTVSPVVMAQNNMATSIMSLAFIIVLIFAMIINASRKKRLTFSVE